MNYDTQTNVLEGRENNDARETQSTFEKRQEGADGLGKKEEARFWSKVKKGDGDSCWIWQAGKYHNGYGRFRLGARMERAHRVSAMIALGEIPAGMKVCHKCDVPACVNPDHLFFGTQIDNMRDAKEKRRCKYGEQVKNSKLKAADVISIRLLRETTNASFRKIASDYGVDKDTISNVISGKTWAHIK
jgi:hypothetical protein